MCEPIDWSNVKSGWHAQAVDQTGSIDARFIAAFDPYYYYHSYELPMDVRSFTPEWASMD